MPGMPLPPAAIHAPAFLLPEKNTHGHAALCLYPLTLCVHEKKKSLKQTIQQGFAGLFHICKQELKAVFKDQGVLIFFLLVPLAYPLVYAFIYTNEVVREVPVAWLTTATRHSAASLSVRWCKRRCAYPVALCGYGRRENLLERNKGYMAFSTFRKASVKTFPPENKLQSVIYCDMSGMLYYKH